MEWGEREVRVKGKGEKVKERASRGGERVEGQRESRGTERERVEGKRERVQISQTN